MNSNNTLPNVLKREEAKKALTALYITVNEEVAKDVNNRVVGYIKQLETLVVAADDEVNKLQKQQTSLCRMIRGGPQDAYSDWTDEEIIAEALDGSED